MKRYDSIGQIGHIFETDQQVVTFRPEKRFRSITLTILS